MIKLQLETNQLVSNSTLSWQAATVKFAKVGCGVARCQSLRHLARWLRFALPRTASDRSNRAPGQAGAGKWWHERTRRHLHTYIPTYLPSYLPACLLACSPTCLPTCLPTRRGVCLLTHPFAYLLAYFLARVLAYLSGLLTDCFA